MTSQHRVNSNPPQPDITRTEVDGLVISSWGYRKWWHRITRHKTDSYFVPAENVTWYFDRRKKVWFL